VWLVGDAAFSKTLYLIIDRAVLKLGLPGSWLQPTGQLLLAVAMLPGI